MRHSVVAVKMKCLILCRLFYIYRSKMEKLVSLENVARSELFPSYITMCNKNCAVCLLRSDVGSIDRSGIGK